MKGNNSNSGDNSGMESDDERNEEESRPGGPTGMAEDEQWEPKSSSGGQNKAGLTKDDLERHFGIGLKEAAIQLGVCNTTLKRACRQGALASCKRHKGDRARLCSRSSKFCGGKARRGQAGCASLDVPATATTVERQVQFAGGTAS